VTQRHPKQASVPSIGNSMSQSSSLQSRDQLVEQYRPYVRNIVSKVIKTVSKDVEFDDLVGYGELGLIEAAERFNPKFNVNFMTFAYYRIRGAIYDGLRGMGWISRSHYAKLRYEERANSYVCSVNERQSSTSGNSLKDEVDRMGEVITGLASIFITSLDASEGLQISDDDEQNNPHKQVEMQQARKILRAAIEKLPEQERLLLEYYYYKDMTLQQAGEKLNLSKSWASRLHARAINKLQKLVKELNPQAGQSPSSSISPRSRTG